MFRFLFERFVEGTSKYTKLRTCTIYKFMWDFVMITKVLQRFFTILQNLTYGKSVASRSCLSQTRRFVFVFCRCTCNQPECKFVTSDKKYWHYFRTDEFASLPERRSSTQNSSFLSYYSFDNGATEESMILDALLPKVFTFVTTVEEKLNGVLVITLKWIDLYSHFIIFLMFFY